MTPRPYRAGERKRAVDEGRARILEAARSVLHLNDIAAFSLDAVAQKAGVTRMTVYNQFGSRAKLLQELFDLMVERDAFSKMPVVLEAPDAVTGFDEFVAILGRFYTDNRAVIARLSAAAGIDPDLDAAMRTRNERRLHVIELLLKRLVQDYEPTLPARDLAKSVDVLLNFPTFNALAGPDRAPKDAVPLVRQLLRGLWGTPKRPSARTKRAKPRSGG